MATLPLPIDGRILTNGILAESCSIFKSNLLPLKLVFLISPPTSQPFPPSLDLTSSSSSPLLIDPPPIPPAPPQEYGVIFKNGDDLRQDQLVLQLFTLMNQLLKKENLDLRLTTYSALATGSEEGMIQFVESKSLATVMREYGSLLDYLRTSSPEEESGGTYGVKPAVLDTFVRSCGESDRDRVGLVLWELPEADSAFDRSDFDPLLSWLLRDHLPPRSRRPPPRQPHACS